MMHGAKQGDKFNEHGIGKLLPHCTLISDGEKMNGSLCEAARKHICIIYIIHIIYTVIYS